MICSSSFVPSVRVVRLCVSPRWKSADPCVRGRRPTSMVIGRISVQPAAVEPLALAEDHLAHRVVLHVVEHRA